MVRHSNYFGLILILAFAQISCTKGTPNFQLLDEGAIPQPQFSGSTTKSLSTSSHNSTFSVTGECDKKISSIKARAVGVQTVYAPLAELATSTIDVRCSTAGTFSLELKSLLGLGFMSYAHGQVFEVELRGATSAGLSRPSKILITYLNSAGNRNMWVSGGGIHGGGDTAFHSTNATFRADLFINSKAVEGSSSHGLSSNTDFSARIGASAR